MSAGISGRGAPRQPVTPRSPASSTRRTMPSFPAVPVMANHLGPADRANADSYGCDVGRVGDDGAVTPVHDRAAPGP